MWSFGHEDWIKYGWGPNMQATRNDCEPLYMDFSNNKIPIKQMASLDAAHLAIEHITKNYPKPYYLMCSGGIDSQTMLWAWHTSGVEYQVVSVKYITDYGWCKRRFNQHDLVTLDEFCGIHGIPINYKTFDVIDFLENGELQKVSKENNCNSPQICTHIKMCSDIEDGTILFSGNFLSMPGANTVDIIRSTLNYTILGLQRRSLVRKMVPFFLNFTPELAYSLSHGREHSVKSDRPIISSLRHHGYPVIEPKQKFNGFEKIKDHYDQYDDTITALQRLQYRSRGGVRAFDFMFRFSLEDRLNPVDGAPAKIIT